MVFQPMTCAPNPPTKIETRPTNTNTNPGPGTDPERPKPNWSFQRWRVSMPRPVVGIQLSKNLTPHPTCARVSGTSTSNRRTRAT